MVGAPCIYANTETTCRSRLTWSIGNHTKVSIRLAMPMHCNGDGRVNQFHISFDLSITHKQYGSLRYLIKQGQVGSEKMCALQQNTSRTHPRCDDDTAIPLLALSKGLINKNPIYQEFALSHQKKTGADRVRDYGIDKAQ